MDGIVVCAEPLGRLQSWVRTVNDVIRYLLGKLPKATLINIIINFHEELFTDPKELQGAFREMAAIIQAQEVYLGNAKLDGFTEPFRTEVETLLNDLFSQFIEKGDNDE